MNDEKVPLVSISDILGVGKLASSPAATRLVEAIVSGVGEMFYPWRLRRNSIAQIEVIKKFDEELPSSIASNIDLDARSIARINVSKRRDQSNRESIARRAIEDLVDIDLNRNIDDIQDKKIDADWVEYYWAKAETVSDEDMQSLWARVLARKATGQGISLRTLDLLRTLSIEEAQVIEYLSKFRIAIGPDQRFLRNTIGLLIFPEVQFEKDSKNPPANITVRGNNVVSKSGIPVDNRCRDLIGNRYAHILEPLGIYLNASSSYEFNLNWNRSPLPLQVGDSQFLIHGLPGGGEDDCSILHFGHGVGFSQIGWEVFSFAKSEPDQEFLSIIQEKLEQRGLRLEHLC